jgi:hypothetical protein
MGWRELKDFGPSDYFAILGRAVAVPVCLLLAGASIGWISSGFKRKSN